MKRSRKSKTFRSPIKLLAIFALLGASGCLAPLEDEERVSDRPWTQTTNWEHGLPTGLTEGR